MSTVALGAYGLAAVLDIRARRVTNALWIALLAWAVWRGVTVAGVLAGLGFGVIGGYAWHKGELGGADVKGIALLPLALPTTWPIALGVGLAALGVALEQREEVPVFAPILVGVVVAVAWNAVGM